MKLEFKSDRDKDFFSVYETVRKESNSYRSVKEISKIAVHREAESYYLTRKQIIQIIQTLRCHPDFENKKCNIDRCKDIFKRYWHYRKLYPTMSIAKIADIIDSEKAPRFYISEKYAYNLIYTLIKNRPRHAIPDCTHIHNSVSDK